VHADTFEHDGDALPHSLIPRASINKSVRIARILRVFLRIRARSRRLNSDSSRVKHMATAKVKVETVTLRHLGNAIAESHEIPKKQAQAVLEDMVGMITKHLKKGSRIRIGGLGVLQVRKRAARMGRNPATGEAIKIKASKKVAFRASKDLKEAV
jgi:DNA-binding protein HU-beta